MRRIGGTLLTVTGFLACPCHLIITLPLLLSLLAGTALGGFLSRNTGLVYTGATIYFVVALALGAWFLFGPARPIREMDVACPTCANRGCLPSKNLIEAARLVYDAAHPRYPGLTPVQMPISWADLVAQKDEIVSEYRAHKYESLLDEPERIQLVSGQAQLLSDHEVEVRTPDGMRRLVGDQLLIATGSLPAIPPVPGLSDVPYLTSDLLSSADDPWGTELREQPRSLLILGGGYIALELGQMFAR